MSPFLYIHLAHLLHRGNYFELGTLELSTDMLPDDSCRHLLFATSILAIFSVGIANTLVLLRVTILWDHKPVCRNNHSQRARGAKHDCRRSSLNSSQRVS